MPDNIAITTKTEASRQPNNSVKFSITALSRQVQRNCNISDANYAGLFSLCGLLLRMRDLFKWEHGMPPWQEPDSEEVLAWVDEREENWQAVSSSELQPIDLNGRLFDPFDMAGINSVLRPHGLVYGAGYVLGMKPSFFLGKLAESRTVADLTVDFVDCELARDIYTTPGMRQGCQIFARRSAMLFFLWDLIQEMRPSIRETIVYALAQYGLNAEAIRLSPRDLGPELYRVANKEMETWIYHEIGEAAEDGFDEQLWQEIVSCYCGTPVEIFARVVKDILADTHEHGLIEHIVQNRLKSSLAFYIAFMRPFSRAVYPEIAWAFR